MEKVELVLKNGGQIMMHLRNGVWKLLVWI